MQGSYTLYTEPLPIFILITDAGESLPRYGAGRRDLSIRANCLVSSRAILCEACKQGCKTSGGMLYSRYL